MKAGRKGAPGPASGGTLPTQEEIEQIINAIADQQGGKIDPRKLANDARDPQHPLHSMFPWDDKEAADEHRVNIARRIIRSVTVRIRVEHVRIDTSAFIRDPELPPKTPGYVRASTLASDKDMAHEALTAEFQRAKSALQRARGYAILFGMTDKIDQFVEALEALSGEVSVMDDKRLSS